MAKIDLTSKDWCELIFKDRNKAYGAYDMRLDTPKRHNMATLIVVIAVILVITLPMLIKFITPERENKIVVNEVTTLAKLPEAEIKRNEELRPMMKPTTPPPPLKSTIKFTAPVIKKDEEVGEEDEIKSQDELAARGPRHRRLQRFRCPRSRRRRGLHHRRTNARIPRWRRGPDEIHQRPCGISRHGHRERY